MHLINTLLIWAFRISMILVLTVMALVALYFAFTSVASTVLAAKARHATSGSGRSHQTSPGHSRMSDQDYWSGY